MVFLPTVGSTNPPVFFAHGHPDAGDFGAVRAQARAAVERIARLLDKAGTSLDGVAKIQLYTTDIDFIDYVADEWQSRTAARPAWTSICLGRESLPLRGSGALLDIIASTLPLRASPAVANEGVTWVQTGNLLFLSGVMAAGERAPQVLATEALPDPYAPLSSASAMALQTDAALTRAAKLLQEAGTSLDRIARAHVYLTDLNLFPDFDTVWRRYFRRLPARTTVEASALRVPGALVSIDLIAAVEGEPRATPDLDELRLKGLPLPKAAYQPSIAVDDLLFVAGQLASDFNTGVPVEARVDPNFRFYGSQLAKQTEYVVDNLEKVLAAAGCTFRSVRKANVFLRQGLPMHDFLTVWEQRVPPNVPSALVAVPGNGLLVPGTEVEIDLIAQLPQALSRA